MVAVSRRPRNCSERLAFWAKRSRGISDEISTLLFERLHYKTLEEIVQGNKRLTDSFSFFWDFQLWYTSYVVMAIRRQFDEQIGHVCLGSLIRDITKHGDCITRGFFVNQVTQGQVGRDEWLFNRLINSRAEGWLNGDGELDTKQCGGNIAN